MNEREKKNRSISNVCIETKLIFVNVNEIPWAIHHNYYWHWKWKSLPKLFVAIWIWCYSPSIVFRLWYFLEYDCSNTVCYDSIQTRKILKVHLSIIDLSKRRKKKYFFPFCWSYSKESLYFWTFCVGWIKMSNFFEFADFAMWKAIAGKSKIIPN